MLKWSFFFFPYSDTQPLPASFSLCKGQWENLFTSYPCPQHSLPLPHTAPHPRLIFSKTGCHTYGPHFRSEVSDTVKYHRSGKPPCSSHPWPSRGWCRPGEAGRAALGAAALCTSAEGQKSRQTGHRGNPGGPAHSRALFLLSHGEKLSRGELWTQTPVSGLVTPVAGSLPNQGEAQVSALVPGPKTDGDCWPLEAVSVYSFTSIHLLELKILWRKSDSHLRRFCGGARRARGIRRHFCGREVFQPQDVWHSARQRGRSVQND